MNYSLQCLLVGLLCMALVPLHVYGQLPDDVPNRPKAGTNLEQTSKSTSTQLRSRDNVTHKLSAQGSQAEIPNVNVSNLTGNESEVSISVNPTNRNNLVICAHSADFTVMNTFFTTDAGLTWTRVALGAAQDGNPATFRFDPTVAFAGDGNVYVAYGIDNGSNRDLVVARSTNGGARYDQFTIVDTEPSLDKWIIGTGPDRNTPNQFNVYLAYRINAGSNVVTRLAASYDQGATFPTDVLVTTTGDLNTFGMPAVGPSGELYVVWDDQTNRPTSSDIRVAVSLDDGNTFSASRLVGTTVVTRNSPRYMIPAQPDRGVLAVPSIAVDRSGGPNNGRAYVAYTVVGGGGANDTEIIVRSSDNQGVNWSAPVRVNTDGGTNSQFLPWLDVDQATGQVVVAWYDARNDPNNQQVEIFLGVSSNGGASFTNTLVSDNPSDQSTGNASRTGNNFLEYIGVASLNGVAFPVWADNSLNLADLDIFTDQIPIGLPPVANAGSDQTLECTGQSGTSVTLNGSGSNDPNGAPLTYTWYKDTTVIAGPTSNASVSVSLTTGVHIIRLEVNDGNLLTDSDEVTITIEDTTPPVIVLNGTNEIVLECGIDAYIEQGATATDLCDASVAVTISGTVDTHTPGTYQVTYNATDESGNNATPVIRIVKVVDTTPPVITVLSAPTTLWSPNHKYFTLYLSNLNIIVEDLCDTELTANNVVITTVNSDEPEDAKGGGDGATKKDIIIGSDCRSVNLRAERMGGGNGRVYTLLLKVADASGNVGQTTYQVHVPHDVASGPLAVANPSLYTVTSSKCEPVASSAIAKATNKKAKVEYGIQSEDRSAADFALEQNIPNPFSSQTFIRFTLPEATSVTLRIYNILGQQVSQLINEVRNAGNYEIEVNSAGLKAGTYIYLLEAGELKAQKKMVIIK